MIHRPPLSWLVAFAAFWYRFIVGDDWTLAVSVAVGLAISAALAAHGVSLWWLIPGIVTVMVGLDLRRASHARR